MARFLPDSGLLIQHIPRTGGTWVEKALGLMKLRRSHWLSKQEKWFPRKHSLISQYRRGSLLEVKYVAAFVRHPMAYYESTWKWIDDLEPHKAFRVWMDGFGQGSDKDKDARWNWHPDLSAAKRFSPDFSEWVRSMLVHEPLWNTRLIEWYVGPENGEFVDFIGRTETLADDFCMMLKTFGYLDEVDRFEEQIRDMAKQNVRSKKVHWDQELLQKVLNTESPIIRRFYDDEQRLFNQMIPARCS